MKQVAEWALEAAVAAGASHGEARVVHERQRGLGTRNGRVSSAADSESLGVGIRVLCRGGWGFAATQRLSREGVEECARLAVEIARASARVQPHPVELLPEPPVVAEWSSPCQIDPFTVPVEECLDLLRRVDLELRAVAGVTLSETSMSFRRYEQWFYNTEGAAIRQTFITTGAGCAAHAFEGDSIQTRSYPNSFGGQYQNKGYELVRELHLVENANRVARECVALLKAPQCPEGRRDLVLDSSQLGLQIHESIGHPIELDRVLGYEANFAGTSFLTLDKLHTLRYGSDLVNVVADARPGHGPGLGTYAFDDEGVAAQCVPIITRGIFEGYLSSRDTAAVIGRERSGGHLRAEGWARVPIVRMSNVSLLPGEDELSFEDLISSTGDGIYMETNRSWSIDDKRYNFQFGCEAAWEIKGGKLGRLLRNPSYSGITTEFWNAMDAVCDRREWTLWGTPNCGKGQPEQGMGTGHGAAPARFRQIKIGGAYGE
ncbi:MAG: TldD/PmbA family protein [Acidobacteriota bacterium]|nr:TldD/PmbA family protein [Acidobacteriota bacterium]